MPTVHSGIEQFRGLVSEVESLVAKHNPPTYPLRWEVWEHEVNHQTQLVAVYPKGCYWTFCNSFAAVPRHLADPTLTSFYVDDRSVFWGECPSLDFALRIMAACGSSGWFSYRTGLQ